MRGRTLRLECLHVMQVSVLINCRRTATVQRAAFYHRRMAMIERSSRMLDREATGAYAHLFQAFADPTRLAIVQHLASGEHRVRDLVEHMGFAQSTVSKHLGFLAECDLVIARPDGRATWYALAHPEALRAVMVVAEALLCATGKDLVLCEHLRSEKGPA